MFPPIDVHLTTEMTPTSIKAKIVEKKENMLHGLVVVFYHHYQPSKLQQMYVPGIVHTKIFPIVQTITMK